MTEFVLKILFHYAVTEHILFLLGVRLLVGDVVWGKIHGFPWWPGKILTMTSSGGQSVQAHVAWYGSSTSSLMQCDQLSHYLDNFKVSSDFF